MYYRYHAIYIQANRYHANLTLDQPWTWKKPWKSPLVLLIVGYGEHKYILDIKISTCPLSKTTRQHRWKCSCPACRLIQFHTFPWIQLNTRTKCVMKQRFTSQESKDRLFPINIIWILHNLFIYIQKWIQDITPS